MSPLPETMAWWRRRIRASHRDPRLAGALLDRRYVRYGLRRLRGFAIARGASALLYVLEVAVLLEVMSVPTAILSLLAAHASSLIGGAWWGATEAQRRAIRATPQDAQRITATWLWWGCGFGAVALVLATAVAYLERAQPIASAYAIVLGIRVASDLPLRAWHARIAARRRIYRVMSLQLVVEATGPVLVLALSERLASWGFFLAMAVSTVVSRLVTYYFIRRAYRAHDWPWVRPRRHLPIPWLAAGGLAIAGVATRITNLVGVVFLALPLPPTAAIGLTMTVGALGAASGWAWTHYVDFLAVGRPLLARLRRRLEWMVIGEAIAVGVIVGGLALAIVYFVAPRSFEVHEPGTILLIPPKWPDPWPYAWALPALALGSALFAATQVIAWMRGAITAVAVTGIAAALGLRYAGALARGSTSTDWYRKAPAGAVRVEHLAMGVVLVACAIALWIAARRRASPASRRVTWELAELRAIAAPASVLHVTLARAGGLVGAFERALETAGARWWSRRGRAWLVEGVSTDAMRRIALDCAGMVGQISAFRTQPSPPRAVHDLELRFDRRVPRHPELSEHQLHQIWKTLRLRLGGGATPRGVRVQPIFEGDVVVGVRARFPTVSE